MGEGWGGGAWEPVLARFTRKAVPVHTPAIYRYITPTVISKNVFISLPSALALVAVPIHKLRIQAFWSIRIPILILYDENLLFIGTFWDKKLKMARKGWISS